jgi:hypothetical protein
MKYEFQGWRWLWDYLPSDQQDQSQGGEPDDQDAESRQSADSDSSPSDGIGDQEADSDSDSDADPDSGDEDFDEGSDDEPEDEIADPGFLPDFIPAPRPLLGFHREGSTFNREFRSWWDFVQCAADDSLYAWNSPGNKSYSNHASHYSGNTSWFATESFDQTLDMALRSGWPEGRTLLQDSLVAVAPQPKVYETLEFEVAGAYPCVPLYCAGDPACMVQDPGSSIRSAKPIIRIDYNNYITSSVEPRDMMLRGAAILSLADSLERSGFSTELRIIGNCRDLARKFTFRYSIVYKQAGEPLDLDRAAFAIAHPSSMRRLAFAILEQHPELEPSFAGNYGAPLYEANDPTSGKPGGAIFVPGSRSDETPERANKAVSDAAQDLLLSIREAA